jgi:predicted Fe-Mo cluster-binding NifX family protein
MKITIATDDGQMISQHFGRAQHYAVLTVEDGQITSRELRDKYGHSSADGHRHSSNHHASDDHGRDGAPNIECDPASSQRFSQVAEDSHNQMVETVADCHVLLAGGMGAPAYHAIQRAGLRPMIVNEPTVDEAAQAYLTGHLRDHRERLH